MAWTTPKTDFDPGDVLTAAEMNAIGENLVSLINLQRDVDRAKTTISSLAAGNDSSDVLSVAITPSANTSLVLVTCQLNVSCEASTPVAARLYRGGSILNDGTGDAAGNRSRITSAVITSTELPTTISFAYLDSPATTSSTTYSVRVRHGSLTAKTITINSSYSDTDLQVFWRTISQLTVQEIPV